ncbi:hypothetical protein IFM89_006983, partial [Coptis chinensis]
INIDPESLKPKLPSKKDLKPYPSTCYLEYKGSSDGIVLAYGRLKPGRCVRIWEVGEAVHYVARTQDRAKNLGSLYVSKIVVSTFSLPTVFCSYLRNITLSLSKLFRGRDVLLLNSGLGNEEEQEKINFFYILRLLNHLMNPAGHVTSAVNWLQHDKYDGIRLKHLKALSSVEWHYRGDYISTVVL